MTKGKLEWIIHDIIRSEGKYEKVSDPEEKEELIMDAFEKYIKEVKIEIEEIDSC